MRSENVCFLSLLSRRLAEYEFYYSVPTSSIYITCIGRAEGAYSNSNLDFS